MGTTNDGRDSVMAGLERMHPTVLVVDDEALMRTVMKRVLVDEGFAVLTAASGEDALELARGGGHADVVLTDLFMPGMGGAELAAALSVIWPDVPVVFMSAATERGMSRLDSRRPVLEKPFEIDALSRCVRQALTG